MARRLRWTGLLPRDMAALIYLGPSFELVDIGTESVAEALDSAAAGDSADNLQETSAAAELRRAIARAGAACGASEEALRSRFLRLLGIWQRSRRHAALLEDVAANAGNLARRPAPLLFSDRVGSNMAAVSWEPLGGVAPEAAFYEIELYRHRSVPSRASRQGHEEGLERLGTFCAPGGPGARNFCLQRLEPLRWYRARVRAVGAGRSWVSSWSREVSFKTLSIKEARAAGLHVSADNFLVKSERCIHSAAIEEQSPESSEDLLPTPEEVERMRLEHVLDLLGDTTNVSNYKGVKNMLDARYCKGGWQDFVKMGSRFGRPASQREERLDRMKLVLAAEELYGHDYPKQNAWSMGPFYYEELGLHNLESAAKL
eukprot:TRINITY_DN39939_c0_g1_i1.p1 TRINITY_DN39939_c0_g1~~TRINITY_DN39939_c0_g1_i1.p1  ORF type:complete len:381 (-),score=68.29 TRINITY_DN39939_c0_g1_i1:27-1142(-)